MENITMGNEAFFDHSDYTVLGLMLLASMLIGIYFGVFDGKKKTVDEYLLGSKQMKPLPVAFSLIASWISGVALIGIPSEVYTVGPACALDCFSLLFACLIGKYFFLPVFFDLRVTSICEYLEFRFNKNVRRLTSVFYNVSYLLFIPSVLLMPSIALSQATGIEMHYVAIIIVAVCVFYTMIGGMKAVIWSDFLQGAISLVAYYIILILGTNNAGGISYVFGKAYKHDKLDISFDPDPFLRFSFWINTIGPFFGFSVVFTASQSTIQRFMSLESEKHVNLVLILLWLGYSLFSLGSVYAGILLYVVYFGCDPVENKVVKRIDQIYPYYVLDKMGYIPALPGFFIVGVISAGLSTLSTGFNTISGVIYEDFIKRKTISEIQGRRIMKGIIILIGIFCILMTFVFDRLGKILSASQTISSVCYAPVGVLFFLGMLFPWANTKGAISGAISSGLVLATIAIGSSIQRVNEFKKDVYPPEFNYCPVVKNSTDSDPLPADNSEVFFLFRISYVLVMSVGLVVGLSVGLVVSYFTGPCDPAEIDPRLISPPLRRFLPEKSGYSYAYKKTPTAETALASEMKPSDGFDIKS